MRLEEVELVHLLWLTIYIGFSNSTDRRWCSVGGRREQAGRDGSLQRIHQRWFSEAFSLDAPWRPCRP